MKAYAITALLLLSVCQEAGAEAPQTLAYDGISVRGKTEAVVSGRAVSLGDVADVASPRVEDDQQVLRLRRITVAASPKAGETVRLEGGRVLERLHDEGIALNSIRYSIPREIAVTRSFREVSLDELEGALREFLGKNPRQLDVQKLSLERAVRIPSYSLGVEVVALETTRPGHIGVDYRSVSGSDEARFQLKATAQSWRMLPVASKPLKRGDVIQADDVKLVKVSDAASNRDAMENIGDILGHAATHDVGQGEVFRAKALALPNVITSGAKVTLVVRDGRLEVSATGTALEAGPVGQQIKVRNDASGKVVSGTVEGPGIVVVGAS